MSWGSENKCERGNGPLSVLGWLRFENAREEKGKMGPYPVYVEGGSIARREGFLWQAGSASELIVGRR